MIRYKVLAKVLPSRLRLVIGKLVSPYQHAFVASHQILDATLIANECIGSCLKFNLPSVISKLDIIKVYDHVCWDFLMTILERMGFSRKWRWVFFVCVLFIYQFWLMAKPRVSSLAQEGYGKVTFYRLCYLSW